MAVDLRISVFDLDRCGPCWAPICRPTAPLRTRSTGFRPLLRGVRVARRSGLPRRGGLHACGRGVAYGPAYVTFARRTSASILSRFGACRRTAPVRLSWR